MPPEINVDAGRLLEIIREENPQAYELAFRRAVIEQQREQIEMLKLQLEGQPAGS